MQQWFNIEGERHLLEAESVEDSGDRMEHILNTFTGFLIEANVSVFFFCFFCLMTPLAPLCVCFHSNQIQQLCLPRRQFSLTAYTVIAFIWRAACRL